MALAINCVSQYRNLYVFIVMVENVTKGRATGSFHNGEKVSLN